MTSRQDYDERTIGQRVRRLREKLGIDQDEMGKLLGRGREWISKLENDKVECPRAIGVVIDHMEEQQANAAGRFALRESGVKREDPVVAPHRGHSPPPEPPTRAECENRLAEILDLAEKFPDGLGIVRSDLTATKNEIRRRLAAHEESEQP